MEKFSFTHHREDGVVWLAPRGYLDHEGGTTLKGIVDAALQEGVLKFVMDFRKIDLISSPGVAALLDISSRVVDDFDGRMVAFGFDNHNAAVLEMSGFFFQATQMSTEEEARKAIQE